MEHNGDMGTIEEEVISNPLKSPVKQKTSKADKNAAFFAHLRKVCND